MSGIVGIYYLDGQSVELKKLQGMVDTIAHRGSDGADIWYRDNVGLGHRMLWTTPESLLERLPLVNLRQDLVITADARIDNRDELICALKIRHIPAEKIPDSQLILWAYEKWGEHCPEKLLGDFAFAIWDRRKQKLFCARDHFGIKPLYYYYSNQILAFASEIKALLSLPEIPCALNQLKVAYYLEMFCEEQIETFYQNIYRLPAASYLSIDPSQNQQICTYWSLNPKNEIRLCSDEEYVEAFREIFFEAVCCRLRSAYPIGSALSGGLDSSSIACTAASVLAESGKPKLHTFSAIFPSLPPQDLPFIDERYYMDAVKSAHQFESHDVRADLLTPLIDLLWQDEEPIFAPNLYIHQGMYECANQNGVRVFLDGIDGDSTISHGWYYLTELAYTGRWHTLLLEVNALGARLGISRKLIIQKYILELLLVQPWSYLQQWLPRGTKTIEPQGNLIAPDFAQKIKVTEKMQSVLALKPRLAFSSRQNHWFNLVTGLYPQLMEITSRVTARFSLEARYPFFDRRLIEFCLALPPEQKLSQGWTRSILRRSMADILPPEVQWRRGKGKLGFNFQRRLIETSKSTLEKTVKQSQTIEEYINMQHLNSAYQRYVSQSEHTGADALTMLAGSVLTLWLEKDEFPT